MRFFKWLGRWPYNNSAPLLFALSVISLVAGAVLSVNVSDGFMVLVILGLVPGLVMTMPGFAYWWTEIREKPMKALRWHQRMAMGLVGLTESLTILLSLGIICPGWRLSYSFRCAKKARQRVQDRINNERKEKS